MTIQRPTKKMTPPPTSLPTPMTVMVCHVKTWNEFYELIDTLDVRMWRNFWISMFRFIFRAFWIENAQIDFFDSGTFLKSSRHWNSGVDTWHTAGTCRYLQIGDMVLDFINDEYLNHTVIDFSVSRIRMSDFLENFHLKNDLWSHALDTDWSAVGHSIFNIWNFDYEC